MSPYEDKEEDETDERGHENQQPEEEALRDTLPLTFLQIFRKCRKPFIYYWQNVLLNLYSKELKSPSENSPTYDIHFCLAISELFRFR